MYSIEQPVTTTTTTTTQLNSLTMATTTTTNQVTCVFITKDKECGLPAIGQCNLCKLHVIQTLMDEEKLEQKRAKVTKTKTKAKDDLPDAAKPTKKAKKAAKDPNKPKKATTSYMAFCAENRAQVVLDNPGFKQTEIIKRLSEMWLDIKEDPEKIKPYVDVAEADKERFKKEMEVYTSSSSSDNETEVTEETIEIAP